MSANSDLVIPSALDADAALRQRNQFGGQHQQCDQNQEAGKEIDRATHSTKDLGDKLTELVRAQNSLHGIQSLASMVSDRFGSSADYLKQVASEVNTLREALPQVTKLTGWPNSPSFTPQQAPEPGRVGLELEDWINFREGFTARARACLELNQRLNTQRSGQFQQEIPEFTWAKESSKPQADAIESGLLQSLSLPQDVSRLLAPHVEILKTLLGVATPGSQILPQMNRLMSQAVFPEEEKKLLTRTSKAIPGEVGTSTIDARKAGASTRMTGRGDATGLNEGMTPTQSIKTASPRLQNGVKNGDYLEAMLKEFASRIREVRGLCGGVNRNLNDGGFERVSEFALETPGDPLQQAIVDYHNSQAGEQTRLIAGEPPGRTEWIEVNANLEQLRQQARAKRGRGSRFELPPLSYAERITPSAVTETRAWEPVADERGAAPVWQMSSLLQSRSFTPGAASPMFDYEVRRILEQRTRLMEEADNPGSTRLLASPLPNPRTRM